ncbi:MAG: arylsulfatase [Puia sp.]|nr:arylsulfatase [Puia sp.]
MKNLPVFVGACLSGILAFLISWTSPRRKPHGKPHSKPNIIYIYADDLGYGELGSYGQRKIRTPNLDRLAAEGMRFTQHYAGAPVCAPSRCMLMTGKDAGHAYIRGNYELGGFDDDREGGQMPLPEGSFTVAKLMKRAGYVTGAIGKWGLGMRGTTGAPWLQGFDYFYGYLDQKQAHNYYPTHLWENERWDSLQNPFFLVHRPLPRGAPDSSFDHYKGKDYSITKLTEKALAFIRANKERPFFLYLPFTTPHVSLQAPDSAVRNYLGRFDEQPYYGEQGYAPCRYPLSTYAAMITYMDQEIGLILAAIGELGLTDNTIVLFSSDNGPTFDVGGQNSEFFNSAGGLRGRKMDLYEGGIREPFIVKWPHRIPAGATSDLISTQYDLMATLSELTGVPASPNDGISYLPTLLGHREQQRRHPYLYWEYPEKGGQVAVRMGRWKGVRSDMQRNRSAPWEIYDLQADPGETIDISKLHPELITRFDSILKKEHQQAHIREWEFVHRKF